MPFLDSKELSFTIAEVLDAARAKVQATEWLAKKLHRKKDRALELDEQAIINIALIHLILAHTEFPHIQLLGFAFDTLNPNFIIAWFDVKNHTNLAEVRTDKEQAEPPASSSAA